METTTERFEQDVVQASHKTPILVDFWAPWCGPCRALGPVLEKMAAAAGGAWRLVKVNTDKEQGLATSHQIQGIPAVKLFNKGEVVGEFTGALPESAIQSFLEQHLPDESTTRLTTAHEARASGDLGTARELAQRVLEDRPEHPEACILLAEMSLPHDPKRARELVEDIPDDGRHTDRLKAVQTLSRLHEGLERGDSDSEAWQHYHEGIRFFTDGALESAIEAWLEALSRNRSLDDDRLREACVALFTWAGPNSELTGNYHNRFASALF